MDFKSYKKSVSGLFSCKKQFVIPRFQREYTWGKLELNEFLDDILSRIKITEDGFLDTSEYFWGSLLLVGDLDDQKTLEVSVVDGQQRITTMTIFLSVIAKIFAKENDAGLSAALWEFVIGKDANTKPFNVLENETPKPYFQWTIQKISEEKMAPTNTEEEKILEAKNFFKANLSQKGLNKKFVRLKKEDLKNFDYIELLKAIRDQLLRSYVICISTEDSNYANMIFEILNAKGKELANVDLIKNAIFEELDDDIPADTAKELWLLIRNNLCSRNNRIEFSTFFRHFWIMRYGKVQDSKLYSDFQSKVKRTKDDYLNLLREMYDFSSVYSKILCPYLLDFENKKEYSFLIDDLNSINNIYGIIQIRPAIMAIMDCRFNRDTLSQKRFKKIIIGISRFHLLYNAICSKRTSSLEKPINTFAHQLFVCTTDTDLSKTVQDFKHSLIDLIPSFEEFSENFRQIKFSKKPLSTNILAKQIVQIIEMIYSSKDVFENDSSIEHILDETDEEISLSIGNLVLLEQSINSVIPVSTFEEKKVYYMESHYSSITKLLNDYKDNKHFTEKIINERTCKMCDDLYQYLKLSIEALV